MDKKNNYFRNNRLSIFTVIVMIFSVAVYVIGIILLKKRDILELLTASADYIAICSWLLLLIQIISFVKDSRRKEHRARKERAFELAKLYANELLIDITYIENVLSKHYNKSNPYELYNSIKNVQLDEFTLSGISAKKEYKKYRCMIKDTQNHIDLDLLFEESMVFNNIMNMEDIKDISKKNQKAIANKRFRTFVLETMNKLEYFSMAVNQNIAEGDMLYSSLHQSYLKFIYFVYPHICEANKDYEILFTNIIELYRNWEKEKSRDGEIVKRLKENAAYEMSRRYIWKSKKISEE